MYSPEWLLVAKFRQFAGANLILQNPVPSQEGEGGIYMEAHIKVALGVLAGFGLGAVAVKGLHAQAKPPAYSFRKSM